MGEPKVHCGPVVRAGISPGVACRRRQRRWQQWKQSAAATNPSPSKIANQQQQQSGSSAAAPARSRARKPRTTTHSLTHEEAFEVDGLLAAAARLHCRCRRGRLVAPQDLSRQVGHICKEAQAGRQAGRMSRVEGGKGQTSYRSLLVAVRMHPAALNTPHHLPPPLPALLHCPNCPPAQAGSQWPA